MKQNKLKRKKEKVKGESMNVYFINI